MKRFLRLSRADKKILSHAFLGLLLVRMALPWLSLRKIQRFARLVAGRSQNSGAAGRTAWAVESAARFLPGTTCLSRALATQALLIRYGYDSRLTIGVSKQLRQPFEAHAWVTCGKEIVIGRAQAGRYIPLLDLGLLP